MKAGILKTQKMSQKNQCGDGLLDPKDAPENFQEITIGFKNGDPESLDGQKLMPHEILEQLNILGCANGIGRLDLVENRYVGMKARGCYETPGGTILLKSA